MANQQKYVFRRAKLEDIKTVRAMMQELADFEKMSDGPKLSEEDLIRDSGLDGGHDFCHIYVLDLQAATEQPSITTIGYAVCFRSFSTWQGKSYFLDELYVRPRYRGSGAGEYMFRQVAAKAHEYSCKRIDFTVLSWNPARNFYARLGAVDLTEKEEWHLYRLEAAQIEKLAKESQQTN